MAIARYSGCVYCTGPQPVQVRYCRFGHDFSIAACTMPCEYGEQGKQVYMLGTMYPAELCEDRTLLSEYFGKHCTPSHVHLTIGNTKSRFFLASSPSVSLLWQIDTD